MCRGSPTIFEENVSTTSREWVTYHAKHVSSTGREFKVDYSPAKMKQVAYVGLKEDEGIGELYLKGYIEGVQSINEEIEGNVYYLSREDEPQQIEALINEVYQKGSDIIFERAGIKQLDVMDAIKAYAQSFGLVYVINSERDLTNYGQLPSGNSIVLGSVVKSLTANLIETVTINQEELTGRQVMLGLDSEGVQLLLNPLNVNETTMQEVEDIKWRIIEGEIVPTFLTN